MTWNKLLEKLEDELEEQPQDEFEYLYEDKYDEQANSDQMERYYESKLLDKI